MLNDPLANMMSLILNSESIGKSECIIKPVSRIIKETVAKGSKLIALTH